jgi:aminopeptidase N
MAQVPASRSSANAEQASLKKAMRWDEEVYGREYDLDVFNIVAVDDFNMGAMENKGLNIFNSSYVLASPETATDGDFERIEASSRMNTSTTGPATGSPAATGSSSASRKG